MLTLKSGCNSNLPKALSFENNNNNNNNLRDASFSSYLNSTEESLVLKLAGNQIYLGSKKPEDEEIGVFGAEKYFNGVLDEDNTRKIPEKYAKKHQNKEDKPVYVSPVKPKIQPGTPSVQSESSWNSNSVLLQSFQRNSGRKQTNKVHGKSFLASLGCKCYCSDKDSVEIDEYGDGNKLNKSASCGEIQAKGTAKEPITTSLNPIDHIAPLNKPRSQSWAKEEKNQEKFYNFPVTDSGLGNFPVKLQFQEVENLPRKSLEVFGSPILEKKTKPSLALEEKLTMLTTWDSAQRAEEIEIPSAAADGGIYNDNESDASSDLFEIESLTSSAANPFLASQASDYMSGCVTPPTGYAPSEASIEWSVVTASAADFSVLSDSEEFRSTVTDPRNKSATVKTAAATTANGDSPRRRPSILLGCKSQKAVRIAGGAYRTNGKAISDPRILSSPPPPPPHKLESFLPVTRFQAEDKVTGFDSRQGQTSFAARSHSSQGSHLLYIQ